MAVHQMLILLKKHSLNNVLGTWVARPFFQINVSLSSIAATQLFIYLNKGDG